MKNSKTVVKGDKTFVYTLVKGAIKEHDFVVSKRYFELMDENGMFLARIIDRLCPIEIIEVKMYNGELAANWYIGESLTKRCSIVNVEILHNKL